MSELVKSIGYDQGEIIRNILRLHVPEGRIDCDPTFSTGAFYNGTGVDPPALRFDIKPQAEGVVEADARHLPLEDDAISCMMLDPPFLATKGNIRIVFKRKKLKHYAVVTINETAYPSMLFVIIRVSIYIVIEVIVVH